MQKQKQRGINTHYLPSRLVLAVRVVFRDFLPSHHSAEIRTADHDFVLFPRYVETRLASNAIDQQSRVANALAVWA